MAGLPKVAIAGATGNLGPAVLKELLDAGFHVTVLTRESSTNKIPDHPNQTIKPVAYDSQPSLISALTGVTAVVSTLAQQAGSGVGKLLVDAALAAGVTRFLPADFGADIALPLNAALPIFHGKAEVREHVESVAAKNPDFTYSYIACGPFFDWCLERSVFFNPKEHSATLYNGGDILFSTTRLSTVGKAVVGVFKNLEETKNQNIRIHDGVTTQNQMIKAIKQADAKDWTTDAKSTKDVEKWAYEELARPDGNRMGAMYAFFSASLYSEHPAYGSDFTGTTWNERLGVKELDGQEMDQIVVDIVKTM